MLMYASLNNVTYFDYDETLEDNSYDTTTMEPPFLPSELNDSTFNSWDGPDSSYSNYGPFTSMLYPMNDDESWESHDTSVCSSTAVNKPLNFPSYEMGLSHWQHKPVDQWTPTDTIDWVKCVASEHNLSLEEIHKFQDVDGHRLINMSESKFMYLEPKNGNILFRAMQSLKYEQGINQLDTFDITADDLVPVEEEFKSTIEHPPIQDPIEDFEQIQPKIKRPPGRPRIPGRRNKKQEKKTGRLWEFIRDLLKKPEYCPSLICWEDHDQGIFRFVHSEKVARLWGTIKENPKMTYEKLSRAMRYYYKRKVLQPVLGRRLVYKFGPTATGWRTQNPNFRMKETH